VTFYARDLARIHDEGFGDFARAAACAFLGRVSPPGLVVELGCGSGISAELLTGAGFDVIGIDASPEMLALARRRAPAGTYLHGSAWDAEIPRCTGVTAFGEVLNYTNAGSGALEGLAARVHDALEPGGVFLFDVATVGRGAGNGAHRREGDGWLLTSETSETGRTLTRRIELTVDGRRSEETHVLHLYERGEVEKCLEGLGFSSETLEGYCDFGFWPGYAGFAARTPAVSG
jgi:SAM-dependent methyltransferase